MEAVARLPARPRLSGAACERLPAVIAWALPFVLVLYLGLEGGGYDAIVRSQVGIALWWVVLAGVVVGALPASRIGRRGWVGIGLLAAFAAWTSLGIGWSESSERSVTELGRVAMYLGVLVLALGLRRPGTARHAVNGLSVAVAVVAGVAVLSRLQPEWFPANETAGFLPGAQSRLSHPLNYWNALAALMALGLPLVLSMVTSSRTVLGQ